MPAARHASRSPAMAEAEGGELRSDTFTLPTPQMLRAMAAGTVRARFVDVNEIAKRKSFQAKKKWNRHTAMMAAQLLTFSRRQKLDIESVDIAALLGEMRPLLDQAAGKDHAVDIRIAPQRLWARTDLNQLELAVLNLVINARGADALHATADQIRRETGVDVSRLIRRDSLKSS